MLRHHRLLESENHTGESVGEVSSLIRADFEDALVEALEDTLRDQKLGAFRSFLQKPVSRWMFPDGMKEMCLSQDAWCWYMVYYYSCTLRRMQARWEHCANKLKDEFNMPVEQIPQGQDWLHT